VTERRGMSEDLAHEAVPPRVVDGALGGRERPLEEELEHGLPREIELAAKQRLVERWVESRVGRLGDRRRRFGGAVEPRAAFRRRLREARGEIAFAEILDELVARPVVRHEAGKAHSARERRMRGDPPPPRVRLIVRIGDADERTVVGKVDPEVTASPDVADERLDRGGLSERAAGERFEAGGVGVEQRR
jgi:hypothetical protein